MSGFDWKGAIGKFAPTIAGLIGTPAAGIGVSLLCNVLGLEPSPENAMKAAEQVAAGSLTGDQLVALRKAEAEAKNQLAKMGLNYDIAKNELVFKDRDSARAREVAVKDWTPHILAYGVAAIWSGINGILLWMAMHHNAVQADMTVFTSGIMKTIDAAFMLILGYYFGASYGSTNQITPVSKED
jgi:hypothetical protein